jgi:hypothetical protein
VCVCVQTTDPVAVHKCAKLNQDLPACKITGMPDTSKSSMQV